VESNRLAREQRPHHQASAHAQAIQGARREQEIVIIIVVVIVVIVDTVPEFGYMHSEGVLGVVFTSQYTT
jgi:hypothetical protein